MTSCNGAYLKGNLNHKDSIRIIDDKDGVVQSPYMAVYDEVHIPKEALFKINTARKGVVTDGVTRLLLRVKSNGPVTFTIKNDDSCELGELTPYDYSGHFTNLFSVYRVGVVDNTLRGSGQYIVTIPHSNNTSSCRNSITIKESHEMNGEQYVFALYRAPINFPLDSDATKVTKKKVIIEASVAYTGESVTQELELYPPPVVLIHGLWSDKDTWKRTKCYVTAAAIPGSIDKDCKPAGLDVLLKERGFKVYLVDYSNKPASTFNPQSASYSIGQLVGETNYALYNTRKKGIAISQVDVVGHSMGGLITRARTTWVHDKYKKLSNYKRGDFHKIITIGTPHQGSPFGNVLTECKDVTTLNCEPDRECYRKCDEEPGDVPVLKCKEKCKVLCRRDGISLKDWMIARGRPMGQGVYDLQVGSKALANIGPTNIPSHAIVGIAPDNSDAEYLINIAFQLHTTLTRFNIRMKDDSPIMVDNLLGKYHDTIVPAKSQRGGLTGQRTSAVHGIVHAPILVQPGETKSQKVYDHVLNLLLSKEDKEKIVRDPYSLQPRKSKQWDFFTKTAVNEQIEYTNCKTREKLAVEGYISGASIKFEPLAGTIVKPGETVQFKFDIKGGTQQEFALFNIDKEFIRVEGEPPYIVKYKVPPYKAGKINIYADTIGSTKESYTLTSHLIILPEGSPVAITSTRKIVLLAQVGATYQLQVIGKYPDESEFDIADSELGTTFTTQSGGDAVITISPDGLIEARGIGRDSVIIANAGKSVEVVVHVGNLPNWQHAAQLYDNKNYAEAFPLMQYLAEDGNKDVQFYLGYMYYNGLGISKDKDLVVKWWREAAEQGHARAQNSLAWLYATSKEPKYQDGQKALDYALKATSQLPKKWWTIGTLAASYARNGQFDKAIETQENSISLLKQDRQASAKYMEGARERLELYNLNVARNFNEFSESLIR